MPRGAKPGERRGGRSKGTPNKRTRIIAEQAMAEGVTMAEIMLGAARAMWDKAHDPDTGLVIDFDMCKVAGELAVKAAPFFHPRLAAIEHTGAEGEAMQHDVRVMTPGQFEEIARRVADDF